VHVPESIVWVVLGPGGKNDPGLTLPEARTHFYAWSIVSSPLTISHDINVCTNVLQRLSAHFHKRPFR
jgi:hypothetical protein